MAEGLKKNEKNELYDFDVPETSIVTSGANKKVFFIKKIDDGDTMDELLALLKELEETTWDREQAVSDALGKIEKVSDKARTAIMGALRLLGPYKDELKGGALGMLSRELGMPGKKEGDGDSKDKDFSQRFKKALELVADENVEAFKLMAEGKDPVEKASKIGDFLKSQMKQHGKSAEDMAKAAEIESGTMGQILSGAIAQPPVRRLKSFAGELGIPVDKLTDLLPTEKETKGDDVSPETEAKLKKLWKENEGMTARIKKMEDDASLKEYVAKAEKELPLIGSPSEIGAMLKDAKDNMGKEPFEKLEERLKAAQAQIEKNDQITKELGHRGGGEDGPVMDKINKAADAEMKRDKDLTKPQAVTKVLESNPKLYDEYEAAQN